MPEQNLYFDSNGVAVLQLGTSFVLNSAVFYNPNGYGIVAHFESPADNGFPIPAGCSLELKQEDTSGPSAGLFIATTTVYFTGGTPKDYVNSIYTYRWWGSGVGSQYSPNAAAVPSGPSGPTSPGPTYTGGGGGGGGAKNI